VLGVQVEHRPMNRAAIALEYATLDPTTYRHPFDLDLFDNECPQAVWRHLRSEFLKTRPNPVVVVVRAEVLA
jgi:hypothetical protein